MSRLDNDIPIRIVRKKKSRHGGHHGGAWKVAYADFVTAMMALFIVLWIISQSKDVKVAIAQYFREPGAVFESTKGRTLLSGAALTPTEELFAELRRREHEKMQEMAQAITEELAREPELRDMMDQVKMEIVKEGLRIELVDASESFFFDIGTATLKPEAVRVLTTIAREVGKLPNPIIIEGHTDSRQYSRIDGYTNFELSTDRANSARRVLSTNGLRPDQVEEVRGYADTRLRNAEDPFDATNRRISITIKFLEPEAGGDND